MGVPGAVMAREGSAACGAQGEPRAEWAGPPGRPGSGMSKELRESVAGSSHHAKPSSGTSRVPWLPAACPLTLDPELRMRTTIPSAA